MSHPGAPQGPLQGLWEEPAVPQRGKQDSRPWGAAPPSPKPHSAQTSQPENAFCSHPSCPRTPGWLGLGGTRGVEGLRGSGFLLQGSGLGQTQLCQVPGLAVGTEL